jgi:hypothetical protein
MPITELLYVVLGTIFGVACCAGLVLACACRKRHQQQQQLQPQPPTHSTPIYQRHPSLLMASSSMEHQNKRLFYGTSAVPNGLSINDDGESIAVLHDSTRFRNPTPPSYPPPVLLSSSSRSITEATAAEHQEQSYIQQHQLND